MNGWYFLSTGPNIWDQISCFGTETDLPVASENDMWKGGDKMKASLLSLFFGNSHFLKVLRNNLIMLNKVVFSLREDVQAEVHTTVVQVLHCGYIQIRILLC